MGEGSVQPSAMSSTKKGTFARVPALTICTRRMGRPFGLSALVGIVTLYQVLAATLPDETKYGFSATLVVGVAPSSSSMATRRVSIPACTVAPALNAKRSSVWPAPE